MLSHEQDNDYILEKNDTCWITIGPYTVFLAHNPDGLLYEIYDSKYDESDGPLHADLLYITTDNNS